jgi:predicted PurR-regulated permease PerM
MASPHTNGAVDWPQVWSLLAKSVCFIASLNLLLLFKDIVILVAMVMAICYALYRPHQWAERLLTRFMPRLYSAQPGKQQPVFGRFLALLLVLFVVAGLLVGCGVALWPALKADTRQITHDAPLLLKQFGISLGSLHGDAWTDVVRTLGEWLAHGVVNGLHYVAGAILVIYLMLDGHTLRLGIQQALPKSLGDVLHNSHAILKTAIAELVLVSLFAGLVMTGVYTLLGFKYALLLGLFNGLCHGLPVAGPWLGLLPGLALSLLSPYPEQFGWLLLWAGGLYLLKEYVVLPYVIGNTLEIHPVLVMVAFLGGMELFGLWGGLFMALPLASLLSALTLDMQRPKKLLLSSPPSTVM